METYDRRKAYESVDFGPYSSRAKHFMDDYLRTIKEYLKLEREHDYLQFADEEEVEAVNRTVLRPVRREAQIAAANLLEEMSQDLVHIGGSEAALPVARAAEHLRKWSRM